MLKKLSANSGLVRNILTLFTGSTIAQAIPVLVSPILTRLYPVEDFAVLTLFATLVSFIGVIIAGRYELGVGLPAEDREAVKLVYLGLVVTSIVGLVFFVFFVIGHGFIADLFNNHSASIYLVGVPIAAILYGYYQSLSYWNIRKRNYTDLAASRVGQSIANSGVSLGMAFTGLGINGLVLGNVAGHMTAFYYTLIRIVSKKELQPHRKNVNMAELKRVAKKYIELPKINGIHAISDMAQTSFVIFLISALFGSLATGFYGLTMRILQAPLNVIGNSFTAVFYKEVSEKISNGQRISKLLRSTQMMLAMISFPLFLCLMIWGPDLFGFVFGEKWRESGEYARILSPWLFLNFVVSPVSHLPVILNEQKRFFVFSLIGNIAVIISIITGSILFSEVRSVLMLVASVQIIFQLSMMLFFRHISHAADRKNAANDT